MNWETVYYNEAVRLWVDSLPVGIRAYYARITGEMRQYGPNLGMPYTRALGEELFEIRARGKEGIARIFYCMAMRNKIMILHGFVKKTDKTPRRDLATARHRLKEVQDENA